MTPHWLSFLLISFLWISQQNQQPSPVPTGPGTQVTLPSSQAEKPETPEESEGAIRQVIAAQAAAWNRKDLEGYMEGYWHSPDLTFFSGATVTSGWEPTLERYRQRYQGAGKEMGALTFSDLQVDVLSPEAAFVRGKWQLKMSDGKTLGGLFTLVFKKRHGVWRIVHDHTSSG
jgi:uncharacterized protein (TIGR02246 family)